MTSVKVYYPQQTLTTLTQTLTERFATLHRRLPLCRAVLFGSWASGRATTGSDVDVLIITQGPTEGAYALAWRILDTPRLELHLYTEAEYAALEPTLERMMRGGIELFNLENASRG